MEKMPIHKEMHFYGPGGRVVPPEMAMVAVERISEWAEVEGGRMYFPARWRAGPVDDPGKVFKFATAAALNAWLAQVTVTAARTQTEIATHSQIQLVPAPHGASIPQQPVATPD
jgi:hypothetical protein